MKNILKKNQLMITALAIMIAVAGYLQFSGNNLDKEEYLPVSGDANAQISDMENFTADGEVKDFNLEGLTDIESLDSDIDVLLEDYPEDGEDAMLPEAETPDEGEIPGDAVFTGTGVLATLSDAKLLKEQVRAKNKETLMGIINSSGLSDEQKKDAVDAMVAMTTVAEQEMGAEILLEAKGFSDVVVSVSDTGVDVVVNAVELTDAQRAQIEDIIKRKTNTEAANIVISTVVQ